MKTLYTIASLVLSLSVLSQPPVLSNDQFFLMMDLELPYELMEAQAQDPGPIGADIVWDFSSMTPEGTNTVFFTGLDNLPHPESFPNGSYAFNDNSGAYLVYEANSTGLFELGYDNVAAVGVYDDPVQRLVFPMIFGDSGTDDFSGVFDIGETQITRTGTISYSYEAHGDILLPGGLVENVAKIHTEESIEEDTPWGVVLSARVSDIWYQANSGRPLMEVWHLNTDGIETQGTRYRDPGPTSIDNHHLVNSLVYPNPAIHNINISGYSEPIDQFIVMSLCGKDVTGMVSRKWNDSGNMQIDISRLAEGYYNLHLSDGIRLETLKFLVVK